MLHWKQWFIFHWKTLKKFFIDVFTQNLFECRRIRTRLVAISTSFLLRNHGGTVEHFVKNGEET